MATAGNGHSRNKYRNPLAIDLGGIQNLLRLRTNYRFNEKLAAEVGADFNVQQQSVFPVAELEYQILTKDRHWGALHATTQGFEYKKAFPKFQRGKAEFTLTGKLGYAFAGRPNVGLDVNAKPWQAVMLGALAVAAAGLPITGEKRFPKGFDISLPTIKTGLAQGEVAATLSRTRNGLMINIHQLNGVLSL